jgi:hypothetical protein
VNRPLRFAFLVGVAAAVGLAAWQHFPLCPLASTFGIPCPGCGLTRATLALLRGDVARALQIHPLVWLLSPLFFGFVGASVVQMFRDPRARRPPPRIRWHGRGMNVVAVFVLLLTLGVWLARFAGYFGGPVPVTSLHAWLAQRL